MRCGGIPILAEAWTYKGPTYRGPTYKGPTYACNFAVVKSDVWAVRFEGSDKDAATAKSLGEFRKVLTDQLSWFVTHHREQNLGDD